MKVKIGPHISYFGPYQLAEKLMFWVPKEKDEYGFPQTADRVYKFGEWLAHGDIASEPEVGEMRSWKSDRHETLLSKFLTWVHSKKRRTIKVHIDSWDTINMDDTLAHIIVPMLRQIKDTKDSAPIVDNEDVPENLRPSKKELVMYNEDGTTDDKFFKRWDWVLDEMIFAFESKLDDSWEDQFETGESDIQWKTLKNGMSEMIRGPKDTKMYDWAGRKAYAERIQNGFRLFGKYFQDLWC